jgi:predicted NBD/HSP70 family sugar kinase/predicted transcriptional regulator
MGRWRRDGGMDMSAMRRHNIRVITDIIRMQGPIARLRIAEVAGLPFRTVYRLTNQLVELGLVKEFACDGRGTGSGRKGWLLNVNADEMWVVAIHVAPESIRAAAMDFGGNIFESVRVGAANIAGERPLIAAIVSVLKRLLKKCESRHGKPSSIGVGHTGIIDYPRGAVKISTHLRVQNFDPTVPIRSVIDAPVVVMNDVESAALAEARFGRGIENPDFAYVTLGEGIGANYVFNRQVYNQGVCCEFGMMVIPPPAEEEDVTNYKAYLGQMASGEAIAFVAQKALESGAESLMTGMLADGPATVTAKIVAQAARQGDELAGEIIANAARRLGIGIVNISHLLGLTLFVVDGDLWDAKDVLWKPLQATIERHAFQPSDIRVESSLLEEEAGILGAGILALDNIFESAVYTQHQ